MPVNRVDGKVAIVTGGGSGLGEASSELLAEEGARVVITDVNGESAEHTADIVRQRGGEATAMQQDVTDASRWEEVIARTIVKYGSLEVLVNNAGISGAGSGPMEDVEFEDWRAVMSVNLDAVFLGCQQAIRAMKQSKSGSIINISSVMGMVGGGGAAYNASKGGVRLLSKSVAVYCGTNGYNIRCNSIHPGYIWTPMVRGIVDVIEELEGSEEALREMLVEKHPIGRLGVPDDIAQGVLFLASDDSGFMTGSELVIDGGYTAV